MEYFVVHPVRSLIIARKKLPASDLGKSHARAGGSVRGFSSRFIDVARRGA